MSVLGGIEIAQTLSALQTSGLAGFRDSVGIAGAAGATLIDRDTG